MEELFKEARQSANAAAWSTGVNLTRAGAVTLEQKTNDEIELNVAPPGHAVGYRVSLYPEDVDWSCECPSTEDVCPHAAAAIIAIRRGLTTTATKTHAKLGYRMARTPKGLRFWRVATTDATAPNDEQELRLSLTQLQTVKSRQGAAKNDLISTLKPTREDLAVEAALGNERRGVLSRHILGKLLTALSKLQQADLDLRLDNQPVVPSPGSSGLMAIIDNHPEGYWLKVEKAPNIRDLFANGALLTKENLLGAIVSPGIPAQDLKMLQAGTVFRREETANLLGELLPRLENTMQVVVNATGLPSRAAAGEQKARLQFTATANGDTLTVLAQIVYGKPPVARVDGDRLTYLGGKVPKRNTQTEKQLRRQLQNGPVSGLALDLGITSLFHKDEAIEAATLLGGEREIAEQNTATEIADFLPHPRPVELSLTPGTHDNETINALSFEPNFQLPQTPHTQSGTKRGQVSAATVLQAWQQGQKHVRLLDNTWAPLPLDWLRQHGERVEHLMAARDVHGQVPRAMAPELNDLLTECAMPTTATLQKVLSALAAARESLQKARFDAKQTAADAEHALPTCTLPSDFTGSLRPYQRLGTTWLMAMRKAGVGALLADDMGLGKTIQTLVAVTGRALVVAPSSVMFNWAAEIERFRPACSICRYHGALRRLDVKADITITTYAILRRDSQQLADVEWDTVVLDEAQAIKNPQSQTAKAAFGLRAGFKIALTGTPIENRLSELWSQMHFLNPGLLGTRQHFEQKYSLGADDAGAMTRLRRQTGELILRRLKHDVDPQLPSRTEVNLYCQLDDTERARYNAILAATREDVLQRLGLGNASPLTVLEALLRLRQAACHPGLLPDCHEASSTKLALLLETLEEVVSEGHKALIFSQWTSLLDLAEPLLQEANISFCRLDGSTRDREAVVSTFQNADGPDAMLISLKAGGVGINLTAADHVFILDPWWNPAAEAQATDRAHRIGQTRPVIIHRLIAKDTVEEQVLALQAHKRELANRAIGATSDVTSGTVESGAPTIEELVKLLDD